MSGYVCGGGGGGDTIKWCLLCNCTLFGGRLFNAIKNELRGKKNKPKATVTLDYGVPLAEQWVYVWECDPRTPDQYWAEFDCIRLCINGRWKRSRISVHVVDSWEGANIARTPLIVSTNVLLGLQIGVEWERRCYWSLPNNETIYTCRWDVHLWKNIILHFHATDCHHDSLKPHLSLKSSAYL